MPEKEVSQQTLTEFLDQARAMDAQKLRDSFLEIDSRIARLEKTVTLQTHNLAVTKDITYAGNWTGADCPAQEFSLAFALLRDAASFLPPYRQLERHIRDFYKSVALLLEEAGETELASRAKKQEASYLPDSFQPETVSQTLPIDIQGWLERPCRWRKKESLALDYPAGTLVRLTADGERHVLESEIPPPVHDLIRKADSWLFITNQGREILETDQRFKIKRTIDLGLPPSPIARHGALHSDKFACAQYNSEIHIFKQDFSKHSVFHFPGATQLRRPIFSEGDLLFINFSPPTAGCSEVIALDESGELRTVYMGLDAPMSLTSHNGSIVADDKNGLHFISAKMADARGPILFFTDLPVDTNKSPYCSSLTLSEEGLQVYVMYHADFLSSQHLTQRVLELKGTEP